MTTTTIASLHDRVERYERLRRRTKPIDEGGEGLTLEAAGLLEQPPLTRARVGAILAKPPAPAGRPARNDERENVRARLRYWQRKRKETKDPARLREIDGEIERLAVELDR